MESYGLGLFTDPAPHNVISFLILKLILDRYKNNSYILAFLFHPSNIMEVYHEHHRS